MTRGRKSDRRQGKVGVVHETVHIDRLTPRTPGNLKNSLQHTASAAARGALRFLFCFSGDAKRSRLLSQMSASTIRRSVWEIATKSVDTWCRSTRPVRKHHTSTREGSKRQPRKPTGGTKLPWLGMMASTTQRRGGGGVPTVPAGTSMSFPDRQLFKAYGSPTSHALQ